MKLDFIFNVTLKPDIVPLDCTSSKEMKKKKKKTVGKKIALPGNRTRTPTLAR